MEEKRKLSEKEQKLYDYLKKENKQMSVYSLKIKFGENIVGVIGKLKQLNLINVIKNIKLEKKYRKQVELNKENL